ncbi:TonB-dependent receptor [Thermaurantimonas aggregans]|nr:TonB-dependent receptor [Thermaurantimonas aggregans]MCX8148330.1 TonB-dependent receptor [Thermaurantimonas aggregans]
MKKLVYLISLWLVGASLLYGQILTITDLVTGEPIERATITSREPRLFTYTNARGQADISDFQTASGIEIRSIGYETQYLTYDQLRRLDFKLQLRQTNVNLDQVTVSASRYTEESRNVPQRTVSLTQKDVMLLQPQTAADLLGQTGEVFIQKSQQAGGSPMIRGFATNRLMYTVDGVRFNTAIFRGGNIQNVINLDPFVVEQAEVIFGPGSIIYGSDAIGGVMTFHTQNPELTLTDKVLINGKALARYSSANRENTGHFTLNVGGRRFASLTAVSFFRFDDLRMGSHGPEEYLRNIYATRIDSADRILYNPDPRVQIPSGYDQFNILQKLRFKPSARWDIKYGFHYSETSSYSRYDRLHRYRNNGLPASAEWNYGPQIWMMNHLSAIHKGQNTLYDQLTLSLATQYFEESRIDRSYGQSRRRTRIERVMAHSFNADLQRSIGRKASLYYGLEYVWNQVNSTGIDTRINTGLVERASSRYPNADWSTYAAYAKYQYRTSEKLLIEAGTRFTSFTTTADFRQNLDFFPFPFEQADLNFSNLVGNIGLAYTPDRTTKISAVLSTGFRAPNVDDIGKVFDSEPGSVTVPNPALKSEYAYNGELSVMKTFADQLKVSLTGYYTFLQNALVRRNFQLNGQDSILYDGQLSRVQAIQNAAQATIWGLQALLEYDFGNGLTASTQANYQKGEEEMDDGTLSPSRHAAPWYGVTRITYRINRLNFQVYAMYSGGFTFDMLNVEERGKPEIYARDPLGRPYSPGWYTLNAKAYYQLTDQVGLTFGLENITDQRYRPYSSGIVAPGRNFVMAIRATF